MPGDKKIGHNVPSYVMTSRGGDMHCTAFLTATGSSFVAISSKGRVLMGFVYSFCVLGTQPLPLCHHRGASPDVLVAGARFELATFGL